MITFTDCKSHECSAFQAYLAMPGYSHSFLKYNVNGVMPHIEATDKMRFGSLVDAIMTKQRADIAHPAYGSAKIVAAYLLDKFPYLLHCKKQVPCTGIAHYGVLQMPMRTLIDFVLPNVATIELKMTDAKNVEALVDHMQYDNQVFIERSLAQVPKGYLLVYSTTTKKVWFRERSCDNSPMWLADKIMTFGTVSH